MTITTPQRVTARYSIDEEDGRTWLVELVEDERVHTYGKTFTKARAAIEEATALWFSTEVGDIGIDTRLPPSYQDPLDDLAEARARLEADQAEVRDRTLDAIRMLRNWMGLSERDIAGVVGLSHQRVHQLVAGDEAG